MTFDEWWFGYAKVMNKRAVTFEAALRTSPGHIQETGMAASAHGGSSTWLFADYVRQFGGTFASVDTSQRVVTEATRNLKPGFSIELTHGDSVEVLRAGRKPIDLLYLDSFDYLGDPERKRMSQVHHLAEIQAAYPRLTEGAHVLIDDCDLENGGKGGMLVPWLEQCGWHKVLSRYQVLMSRDD